MPKCAIQKYIHVKCMQNTKISFVCVPERAIFGLLHKCKIYIIIFLIQIHVCVNAPLLVLKKKFITTLTNRLSQTKFGINSRLL